LAKNSSQEEHRCLLDRFSELQINPSSLFINSPLSSRRKTITLTTKSWLTKIGDTVNYHRLRNFAAQAKLATPISLHAAITMAQPTSDFNTILANS